MGTLARLPAVECVGQRPADGDDVSGPQPHYYAFLSYSHSDNRLAGWLHRRLEEYRVPHALAGRMTKNGVIPKRLTPIFRDQHDLSAAHDLGEEIEAALASSQYLIVLCSPSAALSRWTNAEIEAFKLTRPEGRVLAAIAAGEPFASDIPGREEEECFPPALRFRHDRPGHPTGMHAEPLAADLRGTRESRRMGFLALVAGMLGIGLDELVHRETRRRRARLAWLTAASISGMVLTSALAVTAIQARDEARQQRRQAQGLAAYAGEDLEGFYRSAYEGTGEALRRSGNDPRRVFDHAQNVFWAAKMARQKGRFREAEVRFREYKHLADQIVALEPEKSAYRREQVYAYTNLGILLLEQRRYREAASTLRQSLRVAEALSAAEQHNYEHNKSRVETIAWLGDAQEAAGNLDDAHATRRRQLHLIGDLARTFPGNIEMRRREIAARRALGRLLASRGDVRSGIGELLNSVAMSDRLRRARSDQSQWLQTDANTRFDLADVQLGADQISEAASTIQSACNLVDRFLEHSEGSVDRRVMPYAMCLMERARLALQKREADEALTLVTQALQGIRISPNSIDRRMLEMRVLAVGSDALQALGRRAQSAAWARQALEAIPGSIELRPTEKAIVAELHLHAGNRATAQELISSLSAMGYRHPLYFAGTKHVRDA